MPEAGATIQEAIEKKEPIWFDHPALIEMILRVLDIRTGYWELAINFDIQVASIGTGKGLLPAVFAGVGNLGLRPVETGTQYAVDAASLKWDE